MPWSTRDSPAGMMAACSFQPQTAPNPALCREDLRGERSHGAPVGGVVIIPLKPIFHSFFGLLDLREQAKKKSRDFALEPKGEAAPTAGVDFPSP